MKPEILEWRVLFSAASAVDAQGLMLFASRKPVPS